MNHMKNTLITLALLLCFVASGAQQQNQGILINGGFGGEPAFSANNNSQTADWIDCFSNGVTIFSLPASGILPLSNLPSSIVTNGSTPTLNLASSTNYSLTTATGTLPIVSLPSSVVTNDPVINAWFSTNNITDVYAKNDIGFAVQAEKVKGVWGSVVQASLFMPRYNASNHVSLIGNTWTSTNERFLTKGFYAMSTNLETIALTQPLTNFTISVCFRVDGPAAYNNTLGAPKALLGVYNSNDLSCVTASAMEQNAGAAVDTSIGSTFFTPVSSIANNGSNTLAIAMSGQWSLAVRAAPVFWETLTVSYNSNGFCSTWHNGNPNVWYNSAQVTNLFQSLTVTDVLTTIVIGGGGPTWLAALSSCTNINNTEVLGVLAHNTSCEQNSNNAVADFQFFSDVYGASKVTDFVGASREWNPANFINYNGGNIPITNEWTTIYMLSHPDEFVIQDAYPGTLVAYYTNMAGGGIGASSSGISFVPGAVNIDPSRYPDRTIITCAGDNDLRGGTKTISATVTNFDVYFSPLVTNGIKIKLFEVGPDALAIALNQQNERSYFEQLRLQFPFVGVIDVWNRETVPWLNTVANDGVHPGATNTIAGYNGAYAVMEMVSGLAPIGQYNPANYQISSSLQNSTNGPQFVNFQYVTRDTNGNDLQTFDGSGWTNIQPFLIQTNFILTKQYTNTYGCAITVSANVVTTTAAVVGESSIALMGVASPLVGGWTNTIGVQTTGSSLVVSYTNVLSNFIQTNSPYWFTNTSSGAGDTVSIIGGQIKYP